MSDRLCKQCRRPLAPDAKHNQQYHPGECRKAKTRELMKQYNQDNNSKQRTPVRQITGPAGVYINGPAGRNILGG